MGPIAARIQSSCSEATGAGWMSSLPTYAVTWIAKIQPQLLRSLQANDKIRRTELGQSIPVSGRSCGDRSGLSGLARCSARLDIDCLGGLYGLSGLLDHEMQHTLVEMSVDGSVLRLERQEHRSVE